MEELHTILAYESSPKIIQKKDSFNFSIDSTIISFFAVNDKKRFGKIIDLGSGTGAIPLFMSLLTGSKEIYGIEIQKEIADMSRRSITLNNLEERIKIIDGDIKGISKMFDTSIFDLAISNPPYFRIEDTKDKNDIESLSIARHEIRITMEDIIKEAKTLLKDNGSLVMIQRTERFLETIELLKKYGLSLRRVRFVFPKQDKESYVFMFEAKKSPKIMGLKIESPLYIYDNDDYSEEIKRYFHYGENDEKNE